MQLPHDAALCIVGCTMMGSIDAYYGASTVSLVGVQASQRVRAVPVVEGIRRPILIMGYAALTLLLLLCGCSPSPSPSDAAPTQDILTPSLDTTVVDASLSDEPSLLDASTSDRLDRPDPADRNDAAAAVAPDGWVTVGDASLPVRTFESFGPARQMRHVCPGVLDGEAGIPAPRLIYPLSGLRATSRRPGFRWELAPGTIGARIEVCADPCCARVITAYDANGTTQPPAEMLPPGVVWWRARGRTAEGYGRETSFTWELGIRHRSAPIDTAWDHIRDINGDGYDDIVTSMNTDRRADLYVMYGGASGQPYSPNAILSPPQGGETAKPEGADFNADGRMDISVETFSPVGDSLPRSILWGNTEGLGHQQVLLLEQRSHLHALIDINGDGFDDLSAVTFPGQNIGASDSGRFILFGGPGCNFSGTSPIPDELLGSKGRRVLTTVIGVGDLNGDGYGDILVGDYLFASRGRVLVLRGSGSGPEPRPAQTLRHDEEFVQYFGSTIVPLGDIDGDQLADFMVALPSRREVAVYRGSRSVMAEFVGVVRAPYIPDDRLGDFTFAAEVTLGPGPDLDADGRAEIVVGCQSCFVEGSGRFGEGVLHLFQWRSPDRLDLVWYGTSSGSGSSSSFGGTAQVVGDVDGDGYDDLGVSGPPSGNFLHVFRGGSSEFDVTRRWEREGPSTTGRTRETSFGSYLAALSDEWTARWRDG